MIFFVAKKSKEGKEKEQESWKRPFERREYTCKFVISQKLKDRKIQIFSATKWKKEKVKKSAEKKDNKNGDSCRQDEGEEW